MPTLIRLIIGLAFLVGLAYAAMFALTVMVDPGEKEITVRIPARDLVPAPAPLVNRDTAPQPAVTSTDTPPIAPGADADTPE